MKLIPTATLALALAIESKTVADRFDSTELVVVPLALSNPRFADGTWNPKCGPPEKAIDGAGIGLPDQQNKPELVHSKSADNPEFLVDLPANAAVSEVVFYPRNSKHKDHYERYASLTISVGDTLCKAEQGLGPDDVESRVNTGLKWYCNFAEGDSISVKNKNFIHFTELTAAGYTKPSGPTPAEQFSACETAAKAAAEQSAAQIASLAESVATCEKSAENSQNAIADLQKQLQNSQNIILDLQKSVQNKEQEIADLKKSAIAAKPKTVQSLTLSNARFADGLYYNNLAPWTAIDGTWYNHDNLNDFAHSKSWKNPKFLVDLPSNAVVKTVTIYPRRDCCHHRYAKMTVTVGDNICVPAQNLSKSVVKANINSGLVWNCNDAKGSSIEVANQDWIQIVEIVAAGYQ